MINRRVNVRAGLSPLYLPFYDALCECLISPVEFKDETYSWEPQCGIRSFMAQDREFAKGRENVNGIWVVREPKLVVTRAKGGESPHNYGCATDWCLWNADGEPFWPPNDHPLWKSFIAAASLVGLRPGAEWGDLDHAELKLSVPWSTIGTVFNDKGPEAAKGAIKMTMIPPTVGAPC